MERVDAELRDAPEVAGWIDEVAPGMRDRFSAAVHGRLRVDTHITAAPEVPEVMEDNERSCEDGAAAQKRVEASG